MQSIGKKSWISTSKPTLSRVFWISFIPPHSFYIHGQEKHRLQIIAVQTMKAALMKLCLEIPGLKRMFHEEPPVFSGGQKSQHCFSELCESLGLQMYYTSKSPTFTIKPQTRMLCIAKTIESIKCVKFQLGTHNVKILAMANMINQ